MATSAAPDKATHAPSGKAHIEMSASRRIVMMGLVMTATIMQVLDSTIANVALPHMQASLSATPDTVTWILTSYILASAVAMPLTGWLSSRFGRRNVLLAAVAGFTLASMLCGIATTLPMMVGFRLLQGVFGAFISPLGLALMLDINPPDKHPRAMSLWGLAVMVAPVAGPVLGGWLTEELDWRWVFFINVPFGVISFFGFLTLMPREPHRSLPFDVTGFALLFVALAALQLMLDRGAQMDWFQSTEIWIELGISIGAAWMFIVHTLSTRDAVLPRALFLDRNLVVATLFVTLTMGLLMASAALLPPMLQTLLGHDAYGAGMLTMPRGIGMMAAMLLAGSLTKYIDARMLIGGGMAMTAIALHMMTGFSLDMDNSPIIWSGILQGLGIGFVLLPLNLLAFSTLDARLRTDGASLYNLCRSIGGSIAISTLTALIARTQQVAHSDLAAHVTEQALPSIYPAMKSLGLEPVVAPMAIDMEINRQALMISYIDAFYVMFWAVLAALPLVLLLRVAKDGQEPPPHIAIE